VTERKRFPCGCPGNPDAPNLQPCNGLATQEDFLCDHCRTVQCHTRSNTEMDDWWLCLRLGCPEHTMPGGRPMGAAF
jgi:hypothetical protein